MRGPDLTMKLTEQEGSQVEVFNLFQLFSSYVVDHGQVRVIGKSTKSSGLMAANTTVRFLKIPKSPDTFFQVETLDKTSNVSLIFLW